MSMRTELVAVALFIIVISSGCVLPPSVEDAMMGRDEHSQTPRNSPDKTSTVGPNISGTPTTEDDIEIEGDLGTQTLDVDRLFARVEFLIGVDVEPNGILIRNLSRRRHRQLTGTPITAMLGIDKVALNGSRPAGLTDTNGRVLFDPANGTPTFIERRLVHEFVHVVQVRGELVRPVTAYDATVTRDFALAWRAIIEGGAVYVTDVYVSRYMSDRKNQSVVLLEEYHNASAPGNRLVWGPYVFGVQYVRDQIDSPRQLARLADAVPITTEQLIHNYTRDEEPLSSLPVESEANDTWQQLEEDRVGELYLRTVLRSELGRDRVETAATGWGNDVWLVFADESRTDWGLVWVLAWDSSQDADEFVAAAQTYIQRRDPETDAEFSLRRLSGQRVALVVGDQSFHDAVTLESTGSTITVQVGEPAENRIAHGGQVSTAPGLA